MSRWQFPFKSREEAERYVEQAAQETGKKVFVKKITYTVSIYKIFTSLDAYRKYLRKKKTQFKR